MFSIDETPISNFCNCNCNSAEDFWGRFVLPGQHVFDILKNLFVKKGEIFFEC